MTTHSARQSALQRKRDLRLRIGRSRRRIDNRLRALQEHSRQAISWRTYVSHYPGWTLVAALGAGLAASAGLRSKRTSRWLGSRLMRRALRQVGDRVWEELKRVWTTSTPSPSTEDQESSRDHN